MELPTIFTQFPLFKQWVEDKKLNVRDLSILTEFKSSAPFKPLIKWIEKHKPSHSEGKLILELAGELLLIEAPITFLLLKNKTAKGLMAELKKIRYPKTLFRDQKKSQIIQQLDWPPTIKAKWVREGDKGALSISFKSFSLKDFEQKIKTLTLASQQLSKKPNQLWKS